MEDSRTKASDMTSRGFALEEVYPQLRYRYAVLAYAATSLDDVGDACARATLGCKLIRRTWIIVFT
jgi:hypothetical protein